MGSFGLKLLGFYLLAAFVFAGFSALFSGLGGIFSALTGGPHGDYITRLPKNIVAQVEALGSRPEKKLSVPILFDAKLAQIVDTWGDPRSGWRSHEGTDILAPRGSLVVSPTDAVVTNVGYDTLGGKYVLTGNAGKEQYYFAHLDRFAPDIVPGKILAPGDLIGFVGTTGNAEFTVPHLHFGIYRKSRAQNPYSRLSREFSPEDSFAALGKALITSGHPYALAVSFIDRHFEAIKKALSDGIKPPKEVAVLLSYKNVLAKARLLGENMGPKSKGAGVILLQQLLVAEAAGPAARTLGKTKTSDYFGELTKSALAEYQKALGVSPANGAFGPSTRERAVERLVHRLLPKTTGAPVELSAQY